MGFLDRLKNLLEINTGDDIDITVEEGARVTFVNDGHGMEIDESERHIRYDFGSLDEGEYTETIDIIPEGREEAEDFEREEGEEEYRAIESADPSPVQETIRYFDGVLTDRYHEMLRQALFLRQIMELEHRPSSFQIDERKRDIAERFGDEAYYVIHLCSSGYFDENRYFRELYEEICETPGLDVEDFRDEFETIVTEEVMTLFVNMDDSPRQVQNGIRSNLAKYERYSVNIDFIDVRGIGERCRSSIDEAIENLEERAETLDYDYSRRGRELVVRIYPDSVSGLT